MTALKERAEMTGGCCEDVESDGREDASKGYASRFPKKNKNLLSFVLHMTCFHHLASVASPKSSECHWRCFFSSLSAGKERLKVDRKENSRNFL